MKQLHGSFLPRSLINPAPLSSDQTLAIYILVTVQKGRPNNRANIVRLRLVQVPCGGVLGLSADVDLDVDVAKVGRVC